jgi:hypothetical protein
LRLARPALSIFGEIREHRKQHEAANEGHRFIERESFQTARQNAGVRDAAETVNGSGPNRLDALKQRLSSVNPDYIAKKLAEKSNIRILSDHRGRLIHTSQRTARSGSRAMATTKEDKNPVSATGTCSHSALSLNRAAPDDSYAVDEGNPLAMSAWIPFQEICTPIHSRINAVSRITTLVPVGPSLRRIRSA